MTVADRADARHTEARVWRDLERRIAGAREALAPLGCTCQVCDVALPAHRLAAGRCAACQERVDVRATGYDG